MGINGLLPLLKSIEKNVKLKNYKGMTLAIDGYVILHRSMITCAKDLCLKRPTEKYLIYCKNYIQLYKENGVDLFFVFDGHSFKSKAEVDSERKENREKNLKIALELQERNKSLAYEHFMKACSVTSEMVYNWIQVLKELKIQFVVAPYEADAQLAYLCRNGFCEAAVSEDSDLLVFGCPRVIFKLDKLGNGKEIQISDLHKVKSLNFKGWPHKQFVELCILNGCDYFPGGVVKNFKFMKLHNLFGSFSDSFNILKYFQQQQKFELNEESQIKFMKAYYSFFFQIVYDPKQKCLVNLNPLTEFDNIKLNGFSHDLFEDEFNYIKSGDIDKKYLLELVTGEINAKTFEAIEKTTENVLISNGVTSIVQNTQTNNINSTSNNNEKIVDLKNILTIIKEPMLVEKVRFVRSTIREPELDLLDLKGQENVIYVKAKDDLLTEPQESNEMKYKKFKNILNDLSFKKPTQKANERKLYSKKNGSETLKKFINK